MPSMFENHADMKNMTISVVIIAHREEDRISQCISSVRDFADEIIVVVQTESDPTIRVAEESGALVFINTWVGYAEQRNFALSHAKHDWILQLDADEIVTSSLSKSIVTFVKNHNDDQVAASFYGQDFFYDRWLKYGGTSRTWKARLVKNGASVWGGGLVHEHQIISGNTTKIDGKIQHYSNRSIGHMEEKQIHYIDLFVAQRIAEGRQYASRFDVSVRPAFKFIKTYLLQLGFLDGYAGYLHARFRSHYTFLKYCKLREYHINRYYKAQIDQLISSSNYGRQSRLHGFDRIKTIFKT